MSEVLRSVFGASCRIDKSVNDCCNGKAKLSIKAEFLGRTVYVWSGLQKHFSRKDEEKLEATLTKIRINAEELKKELEEDG